MILRLVAVLTWGVSGGLLLRFVGLWLLLFCVGLVCVLWMLLGLVVVFGFVYNL